MSALEVQCSARFDGWWKYGSVSRQHVGCSSSAPREEKSEALQLPAGHHSYVAPSSFLRTPALCKPLDFVILGPRYLVCIHP